MLRNFYFSIVAFLFLGASAIAQNTNGAIKVLLKDKTTGETIPFANIVAYQNGVQVGVATTDMDGYAMIKPLAPGKYDIKGVYVGYKPTELKGINVSESSTKAVTLELNNDGGVTTDVVEIIAYQEPLIDGEMKSGGTVTREEYQNMATKNINSVAATTAGVFQADEGAALNVRGGRSNNTTYFVDGVKVIGGAGVPQQGVEQIAVITGGLPASYGDATSGVISITTRGPQSKFFGGVELISSQLTDKYGYNSVGFSLGGPILQKKDSLGNKTPLIGFFLSGQGTYEKDPTPSYNKIYQLTDEKLKQVEDKPLRLAPSGQGFYPELDFVTKADMTQSAVRANVASRAVQLNGKLDFKLTPNTNLTLGGALDYSNKHNYTYEYSLFNAQNNAQIIGTTWRAYARINQKFGTNQTGAEKEKNQSVISNAYFTFLASYEQAKYIRQDDTHKDKLFNYGYVGKFNYTVDTGVTRYAQVATPTGSQWVYQGRQIKDVTFERSEVNATAANYTSQVFDYYGSLPTLNNVQSNYGFLNGDRPQNIYSLFSSTGRQFNDYSKRDNTQLRFSSSFSADIKNHAIMVGVEYDQRNESGHSVAAIGLWERMRLLANSHLVSLDKTNLIFVPQLSGSEDYYYARYNYDEANQTQIDKSVRALLGLSKDNQTYVNTDALNPNDLKLSMFSSSDLQFAGSNYNPLVTYYGYDYLGNKDNRSTSLDRFLNEKDANGNNTFAVGAYKPIYVAGYIQDKFDFKDIKFNVGVRVDRFDANQKVIKDPYLFHEAYTAGEKSDGKPSNIKDDYVVYVDNNTSATPTIMGYRNTDQSTNITTWYNSEGKEISDPSALLVDGKIHPWLKDADFASKNAFSVNAFKDYVPQINVMPRVAFSFPISDVANFFAHYDVLTQRPSGSSDPYSSSALNMRFNPMDYYSINSTSSNPFITNSNLKPEKTIDYELGYNQVLNEKKNAAIKITAFYREMRNQITQQTLNQAYPKTYYTYVNRDFGTVKGMSLEFDLRRTGGVSLTANYTLQFADGSGSNANSGANLASSGQPNLRVTLPLDYDQRHNITINLDYRFGEGKDYKGPQFNRKKKDATQTVQIFKNMGANLIFHIGSGSPYTRYTSAVPYGPSPGRSSIAGSLNGSNKPWQFRTDLRIDKNITLLWGKKDSDKRKQANLNIYLQVLNLLNTKNILNVYSYTGNPDDDGYLASATGQANVARSVSPQAFTDQYSIYLNNPSYYARPRTIRIGVLLDF
jgi:hypothetical protein